MLPWVQSSKPFQERKLTNSNASYHFNQIQQESDAQPHSAATPPVRGGASRSHCHHRRRRRRSDPRVLGFSPPRGPRKSPGGVFLGSEHFELKELLGIFLGLGFWGELRFCLGAVVSGGVWWSCLGSLVPKPISGVGQRLSTKIGVSWVSIVNQYRPSWSCQRRWNCKNQGGILYGFSLESGIC